MTAGTGVPVSLAPIDLEGRRRATRPPLAAVTVTVRLARLSPMPTAAVTTPSASVVAPPTRDLRRRC